MFLHKVYLCFTIYNVVDSYLYYKEDKKNFDFKLWIYFN